MLKYKNVPIYDQAAFKGIKAAGVLAYQVLEYIKDYIKVGVSLEELDKLCEDYIRKHNAIPATLGYLGYPKSTCISLNHEVCHGIPNEVQLQEGDILNIDVTVIKDGWFGDTSRMFKVEKVSDLANRLIATTKLCLDEAVKIVKPGCHLGDIGAVIQAIAHKNNFSIVEEYCGHGIGSSFHHEPSILHYGRFGEGMQLKEGMVFTIEPMINAGKKETEELKNGWTVVTKDRSLSAQFEHTLGVTKDSAVIFTLP
ncbi:Methionine aminopeptidase [Candidatus Hepatincolaceae symbiont of Richtersius coronifer]